MDVVKILLYSQKLNAHNSVRQALNLAYFSIEICNPHLLNQIVIIRCMFSVPVLLSPLLVQFSH